MSLRHVCDKTGECGLKATDAIQASKMPRCKDDGNKQQDLDVTGVHCPTCVPRPQAGRELHQQEHRNCPPWRTCSPPLCRPSRSLGGVLSGAIDDRERERERPVSPSPGALARCSLVVRVGARQKEQSREERGGEKKGNNLHVRITPICNRDERAISVRLGKCIF